MQITCDEAADLPARTENTFGIVKAAQARVISGVGRSPPPRIGLHLRKMSVRASINWLR